MTSAFLEHANLTVDHMEENAALLCELFGWTQRWAGTTASGDKCVHIGAEHSYIALCETGNPDSSPTPHSNDQRTAISFNHIGIVVDNLDIIEQRVVQAGLQPHSHGEYEPGRRFYFATPTQLEIEVVSYT